jgi:hypothetical protein
MILKKMKKKKLLTWQNQKKNQKLQENKSNLQMRVTKINFKQNTFSQKTLHVWVSLKEFEGWGTKDDKVDKK